MSALLFNLGLEPLLQQINTNPEIKSAHRQKVVAYADDLTACIKTDSIPAFFKLFENFARIAGLEVNETKTEIASLGDLPATFSKSAEIEVLGVPVWPVNSKNPKINEQAGNGSSRRHI